MHIVADALVVVHFAFVLFVVFGGFLSLCRPWIAWLHLPCAGWGALVEFADLACPLTTLEHALRGMDAEAGFVARLLMPVLYPDLALPGVLTPTVRFALGAGVVVVNVAVYGWAFKRRRRTSPTP